jgi:hypothetical protein
MKTSYSSSKLPANLFTVSSPLPVIADYSSPAIIVALCYAIRIQLTHGGEKGRMGPISLMDREDTEPLLTTISEDV